MADELKNRCQTLNEGSIKYRTALGEAYKADNRFADSLEVFGCGHEDPISASIGGPIMTKFINAFRELASYKELHCSQLATIGLAADENPFGVVLGGIIGQALCTTVAVLGGKSLASQISEKIVIQIHAFPFTLVQKSRVELNKCLAKPFRICSQKAINLSYSGSSPVYPPQSLYHGISAQKRFFGCILQHVQSLSTFAQSEQRIMCLPGTSEVLKSTKDKHSELDANQLLRKWALQPVQNKVLTIEEYFDEPFVNEVRVGAYNGFQLGNKAKQLIRVMMKKLVDEGRSGWPTTYRIRDITVENKEIIITSLKEVDSIDLAMRNVEELNFKFCGSRLEVVPLDVMQMLSYFTDVDTFWLHSEYLLNHPCTWNKERIEYSISRMRDLLKKGTHIPYPVYMYSQNLLGNWVQRTKDRLFDNQEWDPAFIDAAKGVYSYNQVVTNNVYNNRKTRLKGFITYLRNLSSHVEDHLKTQNIDKSKEIEKLLLILYPELLSDIGSLLFYDTNFNIAFRYTQHQFNPLDWFTVKNQYLLSSSFSHRNYKHEFRYLALDWFNLSLHME
ncbi:hypothetical protein V6N13_035724 [Hibiscus sabdariffa]